MCKNPDGSSTVSEWMTENRLLEKHYLLMEGYDVTLAKDKGACLSSDKKFNIGLFGF